MKRLKKVRFYVELAGVQLVRGLLRLMPLGLAREFGALLGWKVYRIFGVRRRVSIDNIRRSLPSVTSRKEADRIASAAYSNFGRSMMEFVSFDRMDYDRVRQMCEITGTEWLDRSLEGGKGAIVFTGHQGTWEMLGAAFNAYGYPLTPIVLRQSNPLVDRVLNDLRLSQYRGTIYRETGLKEVFRTLDANEFVCIAGDQDAGKDGVFVNFLGRPASAARGTALFAIKRGVPIVPGFIHRSGRSKHVVEIMPIIWPDPSLDREDAVTDLTQRATDCLADQVRKYPTEYFWAHRRWKTPASITS
jgi:KDO2-lipid IV(A) lauroyltransferase